MEPVEFFQEPPRLGNQYRADRVLRSYLARALPQEASGKAIPAFEEMGELAGGRLFELQVADRLNEPSLTQWDPWGKRVDEIGVSPLWREAQEIACRFGLVAIPYERSFGAYSRVCQFALVYLFHSSSDVYTCPLAMSDGAAKTLVFHDNKELIERALGRLTSRDAACAWTSGQWMTERTGGSDVGQSQTVARRVGDAWYLDGTKWFTSATTSEMALTLARPEGNGPGGKGLALFYLETRNQDGELNGISVNRLKDKLGTRKVPTAELTLNGAIAIPVAGLKGGVRAIAPMLNVTRLWNSFCALAEMRRAIALARDYGSRRRAFGSKLSEKPLHLDTLAGLQAEYEAAFHLSFFVAELLGREEAGKASEADSRLLRLVTPLVKLTTGKQVVMVASEALEAFGGAGYVEDTGLPRLLRDAQVLPIWEGTTNVLSLDVLRAIASEQALDVFASQVSQAVTGARHPELVEAGRCALGAMEHAVHCLVEASKGEGHMLEANARRLALTLGRSLALALLVSHAQWSLENEHDPRAMIAARRFAQNGVDLMGEKSLSYDEARAVANDEPLSSD